MTLKNEFTGETITVNTAEEAYDAFCELCGCDLCEQITTDDELEMLSKDVIKSEKEYKEAQELYALITKAKNEQIVLANKLDEIASLQQEKVKDKFQTLQEVSEMFNEAYENSEYADEGICENCTINPAEKCDKTEENDKNSVSDKTTSHSAKSSIKVGDNFCEVEAHWNAPVTETVWNYVVKQLANHIKKD